MTQSIEGGTDKDLFSITASGDLSFSDAVILRILLTQIPTIFMRSPFKPVTVIKLQH